MALRGQKSEQPEIDASNGAQPEAPFTVGETAKPKVSIMQQALGFSGRDIFVMTSNQGSEYTTLMAAGIVEVYKANAVNARPKLHILDREKLPNLAYSALVVSKLIGKECFYHTIILEATGRAPMTAQEYMNEVNAPRHSSQKPMTFTPDEALDSVLHEEVHRMLFPEYGDVEYVSTDGTLVPTSADHTIAPQLATTAHNAIAIDSFLTDGNSDVNITVALNEQTNTMLKIETNLLKQTVKNEVGNPVRQDFAVELNSIDTSTQNTSINLQNGRDTLCKVTGFIDAIPEEVTIPTLLPTGMTVGATQLRLRPHIILDSASAKLPTPGFMLMAIVNSLVMTSDNMWVPNLMPKDKHDINDVGALNILTNLGNNADGVGEHINLLDKALTSDEAYGMIKQMFTLDPMVSIDIESFGPETFYTSILAIAARPGNDAGKQAATAELIKTAHTLTNGNFPANFNPNNIFANSGVLVPLGTWADKSGERDIRDIDLAFIAKDKRDVALLNEWTLSNFPVEVSNQDPFTTKVNIINQIIPDASIRSKAVRVTFTAEFINTLVNAADAAGLNPTYEPNVLFEKANSLSVVAGYVNHAGIQNGASFARGSAGNQGNVYHTNYGNMGYNRHM